MIYNYLNRLSIIKILFLYLIIRNSRIANRRLTESIENSDYEKT